MKTTMITEYAKYQKFLDALSRKGWTFRFEHTRTTATLLTEDRKWLFGVDPQEEGMNQFLPLRKLVHNDAEKYLIDHKMPKSQPVNLRYYDWDYELRHGGDTQLLLHRVDLKAAYWSAARNIFMSEKAHTMGVENKKCRLKALGSLATKKKWYKYEGHKIVDSGVIYDEQKRGLYLHICDYVDSGMRELFDFSGGIAGYWVDCFFVRDRFTLKWLQKQLDDRELLHRDEGQSTYVLRTVGNSDFLYDIQTGKYYPANPPVDLERLDFDREKLQSTLLEL